MKALFRITNPNQVEMSLKLTMTLEDWKRLKSQLASSGYTGSSYPAFRLIDEIQNMTALAEQKFFAEEDSAS